MPRTKGLRNVAVVLAALVRIADQQANRRTSGDLQTRRKESRRRRLLRCVTRDGARLAAVEIGLDVLGRQRQPRGQPSMTQPIAGPCDSPKVVTAKRVPGYFMRSILFIAPRRGADQHLIRQCDAFVETPAFVDRVAGPLVVKASRDHKATVRSRSFAAAANAAPCHGTMTIIVLAVNHEHWHCYLRTASRVFIS